MKFNETLTTKILRESADDKERTVVAGVLEGDFLSANKRFYPEAIVRSAAETLVGKSSMIGHDTNSPRDVVAKIINSTMSGKKLIASFKFGSDASSQEMFTKVKEGLVDSYSIRAWGESKPGKINGEDVYIVTELQIETVDLVVTPGVSSAKVLKVYESSPEINFNKEEDVEIKELEAQLAEANRKLEATESARLALEESNKKAEEARLKAELNAQIEKDLATIKEEYREDSKGDFVGSTKEDWAKHFELRKKTLEKLVKKSNSSDTVIITPTDTEEKKKSYRTINDTLEDADLSQDDKKKILISMMGGKVAK